MTADAELGRFYRDVRDAHLQPLWVDTGAYVPQQPAPKVVAAHWPAATLFALLREAGHRVSPEMADRRVLVCNNPGLPPFSGTTQTLYACVQLLLPGERTNEHRHTQSAFRFLLDGEGAATTLNGRRVYMGPGDLIVTPPWTWHGHLNDSANAVVWLDGLDNAIVRMFDATFFEGAAEKDPSGDPPEASEEPGYWHFARSSMERQLDAVRVSGPIHPAHGYRIRYLDPNTGADPLTTMAAYLSLLPGGFRGALYRSSDSTVFVVAAGEGRTLLESGPIQWSRNDIFVVPTWQSYRHEVEQEALLFSFSDRAAQERLGCWREQSDD